MISILIALLMMGETFEFWKPENILKRLNLLYSMFQPKIQATYGQYIFLLFLDMLAGYGYKPVRSIAAYLFIIVTFASVYFYIGHGTITPVGAFVFSITSFHGRGFFPGTNPNGKPLPLDEVEPLLWSP